MYSGEASSMWEGQLAKAKNKCRKLVKVKFREAQPSESGVNIEKPFQDLGLLIPHN